MALLLTKPQRKRWLLIALILVFFAHLCLGAKQLSLTSDEPAHLVNGYTILSTGEYWTVPSHGHPPLANIWTSWPVLLEDERPTGPALPGWRDNLIEYTRAFWPEFQSLDRLALLIRYPNMLLGILLLALVYRWANRGAGAWGGLLAVWLFIWDPTLVAHAQLNTTDLGLTFFAFATCYLLESLRREFSYLKLLGVGILTGAAMSTKTSGLMLLPVSTLLAGVGLFERHKKRPLPWKLQQSLLQILIVGGSSALFLLTTYGFDYSALFGSEFRLPLAHHIEMIQIFLKGKDRFAFAKGQLKAGGWWWYFPFAFLIKTPIPLLITYVAAALKNLNKPKRFLWEKRNLWLFPVLYLVIAMNSGVNIGYRHLLPLFPFAYVTVAELTRGFQLSQRRQIRHFMILVIVILALWYMGGTLHVAPFSLAYFNEFVGGPSQGYKYLVDSNLSWGQSFKALNHYLQTHDIDDVYLSYSTWIDPEAYGISYHPLFPAPGMESFMPQRYDPAPGVYAISATTLQGIALKEHDPDLYEWFRHRKPDAQPGYGINVYHVERHTPPATWIAQCNHPVVPLPPDALVEGFGNDSLRQVHFDCRQSWIYPTGGEFSGWYSFHGDLQRAPTLVMQDFLKESKLSYQQRTFRALPPFSLYKWDGAPLTSLDPIQTTVTAAPIAWPPNEAIADGDLIQAPIETNGPLTFLGYHVPHSQFDPGKTARFYTIWKVNTKPQDSLSIIGHMVDVEGKPLAVADGMGVPIYQWREGDIIVQNHALDIPADVPPGLYWLHTGAYWLESVERWAIYPSGYDRLLLERIGIK